MKRGKYMWAFTALIIILYVAALLVIRVGSPARVQRDTYNQWRQSYVIQEDEQHAFVNTSNNKSKAVALSEGQGYGMYITAIAGSKGWAQQQDFDNLLRYYLEHRDYIGEQQTIPTYLMQWRQYKEGQTWVSQDSSATDGDLYIAFSLYRASKVWPKRSSYYLEIERQLTADILSYEYNSTTHTLTVGNWANQDSTYYNLMRSSDVMPDFFEAFYESTHDKRWLTVSNTMLDRLVDLSNAHSTGLIPDFAWITVDGAQAVQGKAVASKHDGDYSSNACRVPLMLATSDNPRAKKVMKKLLQFFNQQDFITAGYSLSGKPLNDYQSNSFTAPLAFAAEQQQQQHADRLLKNRQTILTEKLETNNYYDATLTTMAVMGEVD